jgi:2-oxoglutarate dehydrogenase E2 component (dihydrolipoamide succinyltransferase)
MSPRPQPAATAPAPVAASGGGVSRKRMTPLRQRIAQRLVQAQHTAAILTTFNEVDMTAAMDLRKKWKEDFEKKHGTGLGFMSIFSIAAVKALQKFPGINSQIDGTDVVSFDHINLGIAVGTEKGLVVPVLKHAENMGFADVEKAIRSYALKAREGKLAVDDMQGGTFTITNGGTYGSLMSTPIINPPQSGILGMHAIKDRPMAVNGQVVIRPMMYIALSYDHRIVDGAEAVGFLVRIKELVEAPERMLLGL